jgi:tetratricopeptide (TPR) repeat protein
MRAPWLVASLISVVVLQGPASADEATKPPEAASVQPVPDVNDLPETVAERDRLIGELFMRLQDAKDAETGTRIATAIERLWVYSGSDTADLLLGRATTAIEGRQADVAREVLDALIGLEPRYAEAWNRRAYLNYSEQNYAGALSDLSHVLALEPRHFKALEGLGSILKEIGQKRLALKAYRKVLELYPMADEARAAAEALAREVEGQKI